MFFLHMQIPINKMRILKYKDFILEKIIPQPTDTAEKVSTVNRLNDLEKDINDFKKFKGEIENIYSVAKDDKDLNLQLSNFFKKINANDQANVKLFVDTLKSGKKPKTEFPNPLLAIWANLSKKKREIRKLEKQIDKLKGKIAEESSNTDPDTSELSQKEVTQDIEKLKDKQKDISRLGEEVKKLEKDAKDKLNLMNKELQKGILDVKKEREAQKVKSSEETKPEK